MAAHKPSIFIDRGLLIDLVRERPAIWDKNSHKYKIKSARNEAWREICGILNEDYDTNYTHSEKVEFYMSVVRAWTTVRDGWVRSLKKRQSSLRRPYYNHDKLLFLQDVINPQPSTPNTSYEKVEYLYTESNDDNESERSDDSVDVKPNIKRQKANRSMLRLSKDVQSDSNEAFEEEIEELRPKRCRLQDGLKTRSEEVMIPFPVFEDRHLCFFRSIQPTLATLDEGQVLDFQTGVLGLLQRIRNCHSHE